MIRVRKFVKKELVFSIALLIAIISMFFVPVDQEYLHYFDTKTLVSLFVIMLILAGFTKIRIFDYISRKLIARLNNARKLIAGLIFITFFSSMFIANDMALLTFLPLTLITLKDANKEEYLIFTIIMQNIAANLGGMLTPFGNPENLYLYSYFSIDSIEFMSIMLKPFLISIVMTIAICFIIPKTHLELPALKMETPSRRKMIIFSLFSILIILAVFRVFDYLIITAIVMVYFLIFERNCFKQVDYFLLLTFTCFFIFTGNFARIEAINTIVTGLLEKSTYITSIISCQIISNVPTAVFLSKFTTNYKDLLLAVNVGSIGTLVSSLASLISFRIYTKKYSNYTKKYLLNFAMLNVLFLSVLSIITYYIK